ncbi:MAG: CCA tRNA nucleotidyltransferase [Thermoplasmata archaeon]|nr:CCA tRNA nucleotidyltransferase [Thermoplasmata archaeon]
MGTAPADPPHRAQEVEQGVLEQIRPTPALLARVAAARDHLVERGTQAARERNFPLVRCLVAGSAARGTFLADRIDLDFFLLFPPDLQRSELERMGLELGAALLTDTETRYAEHPYRRGWFDGFQVDAVPGYAITDSSRPQTAVDRTPFHQAYLSARETPALVDQIRLTKQFLRALGVYGSEARRGGCSGYLVELLVLRFGSLQGLLTAARGWRLPVRLLSRPDVAPRAPEDVALLLDDPVDPARNVATALTARNLATLILGAGAYLDDPDPAWFAAKTVPPPSCEEGLKQIHARSTHVGALVLPRPALVDDILYPQLHKAERAMADEAKRLGFAVLGTSSAAGEGELILLLEVEHAERPAVRVHDGPPAGIDRVSAFLEKWSAPEAPVMQGPYVTEDGRLAVDARREHRRLEPLLTAALGQLPIGRDLRASLAEGTRVQPLAELPDSPQLREALGDLLGKRLPWKPARN